MAFLLLAGASGCSSFNRDWNALAESAAPLPAGEGFHGRWEGMWHSEPSGHEGSLRCIVRAIDPGHSSAEAAAATHLFRFSATWGPGFVSDYDIAMTTRPESPTRVAFEGTMSLGLFGEYACKGYIEGETFFATYTAKSDHGTFEMKRPVK